MLGFIMELDEETRKKVLDYLGNPTDAVTGAIRTLMMSAAGTVIFPVQDLLGYGADTRINTPGNPHGNWRYRITDEQLNSIDLEKFAYMNRIYARGAESLT
jgi:4-alpha-glucanotransferase